MPKRAGFNDVSVRVFCNNKWVMRAVKITLTGKLNEKRQKMHLKGPCMKILALRVLNCIYDHHSKYCRTFYTCVSETKSPVACFILPIISTYRCTDSKIHLNQHISLSCTFCVIFFIIISRCLCNSMTRNTLSLLYSTLPLYILKLI